MELVANLLGVIIEEEMGTCFGIMWDGWSTGTRHYVAVFVVYNTANGTVERLIGMSPMEDGQIADAQIEHFAAILAVYGKATTMTNFVKLQQHNHTLVEVRALFDACINKYPGTSDYLAADANIVHSPLFESAVVKIATSLPLSNAELKTIESFQVSTPSASQEAPPAADFATEVLRQVKMS
ncbi:unnamed protein product [Phytophthora fragariaefolia]|uniref:Unnamed protein product n=1 Tax=Phytophthora fragariaefolia TaxID=1490495 RepID=A0A9W7CYS9_9STRA|nr:unnamed protein product [Phytophthora fragariaefolia]